MKYRSDVYFLENPPPWFNIIAWAVRILLLLAIIAEIT